MSQEAKKGGCLSPFISMIQAIMGTFFGLLFCGVVIFGCVGVFCVIVVLSSSEAEKTKSEDLIEANGGNGSKDSPIASNEWLVFNDVRLRPIEVIRPANSEVKQIAQFLEDPAAGADYVIVNFEVECLAVTCNSAGSGFRLIDADGKEWDEKQVLLLDESLDTKEGVKDATYEGIQIFEFPTAGELTLLYIRWNNSGWLYTELPS
jgi:hypothetical protein